MSKRTSPETDPTRPLVYQIRVEGRLSEQWADWFEDGSLTYDEHGNTLLTCTLIDQAALHGLLKRIRDLGIPLLSVNRQEKNE